MNSLNIWVKDIHAATLTEVENTFSLIYTDVWNVNGYAFSPHLPLNEVSSGASVRNFFSNLLPEGQLLEGLSQAYQVSKYDVFGILRKVGKDCAGALVLTDPENNPDIDHAATENDYQEISSLDLNDRIRDASIHNTPVMLWNAIPRMSLAGVQNKLGIYIDINDKFYLPIGSAPTSHILKPDKLTGEHNSIAANEYFCMQLASEIGLNVPFTSYRQLPIPIYLVQRYDRIWTSEGKLVRTHQIDGCQALNLPPNLKYEEEFRDGPLGATMKDLLELSNLCKVPAIAKQQLLRWVIFNYLIGNSDAHAKNISFLINHHYLDENNQIVVDQGMKIAPLYDLVCGRVYDYVELAQSIGGETEIPLIGRLEWTKFADECGISFAALQKIASQLVKRLDKSLPKMTERIMQETDQPIVEKIAEIIHLHSQYLRDSLIS